MSKPYTLVELLIIATAREVHDYENVVLGTGIPMTVGVVAKNIHAKNCVLIMESGMVDFKPLSPLRHIGDVGACEGFSFSTDLFSIFTSITYRGFADLCFLGVAQVDKFGNVNTTAKGDYYNFDRRLTGAGGAPDFISHAKRTVLTLNKGEFVEKLDYVTSPGYLQGKDERNKTNHFSPGSGPTKLISTKGIFKFDPITKEMYLAQTQPGFTVDEIKKDIPWELKVAQNLSEALPPTDKELEFLRKFNPIYSLGGAIAYRFINKNVNMDLTEKGKKLISKLIGRDVST